MSLFDDVSWTRSSFCSVGDCIDVGWRKSSFSSDSQNCLEVKSEHQVVYVRDSKQTRDDGQHYGPIQVWELDEWRQLLRCVKVDWDPTGVSFADEAVIVGLERHEHMLAFSNAEWVAFVDGVLNEEFEPAVLSSKYRAATGADGSDGQGFPVATPSGTAPVAAELPGWVERQRKLASLDDELDVLISPAGRPVDASSGVKSSVVAGQPGSAHLRPDGSDDRYWFGVIDIDSPAGRLDEDPAPQLESSSIHSNPTAGQPGPEPAVAAVGGPVGLLRSEAGTGTSPGPVPAAEPQINFSLLAELATKPHPLLNIGDEPSPWWGEVHQEARNTHHLLDMVGIPHGKGYAQDLDARAWLAVVKLQQLQERLDRIAAWHSRQTGPSGTFDDYCRECGCIWPCDTQRMATGSYVDDETELAKAVAPLVPTDGAS